MKSMKQRQLTHNDLPWAIESILERMEKLERLLSAKDENDYADSRADFLNVSQAAEFLGLTKSGVYHKIHKKEIPFIKVHNSNRVRFSRKSLSLWLLDEQRDAA